MIRDGNWVFSLFHALRRDISSLFCNRKELSLVFTWLISTDTTIRNALKHESSFQHILDTPLLSTGLTPIQTLIYYERNDIQTHYPLPYNKDDFIQWFYKYGVKEHNLWDYLSNNEIQSICENFPVLSHLVSQCESGKNDAEVSFFSHAADGQKWFSPYRWTYRSRNIQYARSDLTWLISLIHRLRPDLRSLCSDAHDDGLSFFTWLVCSGYKEYVAIRESSGFRELMSRRIPGMGLTVLQSLIYYGRKDVRDMYPLEKHKEDILNWFYQYGVAEHAVQDLLDDFCSLHIK